MKITTAEDLLSTISNYFNNESFTYADITFLLILPGIILLFWLFNYTKPANREKGTFSDISDSDMKIIKQIASQKGLSSFDRDFLIIEALGIYVEPLSVLLDHKCFNRLYSVLEDRIKKSGADISKDEKLRTMNKLRRKLFG